MNKKEIKKLVNKKPTKEEVEQKALQLADEPAPDFLDIMLQKSPRIGRAVSLFLAGSHTRVEIANILGVQATTVGKWLRDPDVRKYIEDYQREENKMVKCRIEAATAAAIDTMVDLLDSPIDGIKYQAAKDLLDRSGHKPEQKIKKEVTVKTYEQRLLALVGDSIDVDYEEVNDDNDKKEDD